MAQKKHVVLIDDLDGSPASETVHLGLDGVDYEIDLNEAHAEALRETFAEWIGPARKVGGRKRPSTGRRAASAATASSGGDTAKIREWARQNGYTVSERGRIPASVREAYELAH
ncbi:Lsr2 family protein [Georgenia sp. M64]|uniref:histone-like nucleoid-structuring protein Lsr2 n=1 Tax=Georgenia sp. M64 TaxID=3120520 RepID=UPI0030E3BD23